MERRPLFYCGERALLSIAGKKIILIDDGIATGAIITSAVIAIKKFLPTELLVAATKHT